MGQRIVSVTTTIVITDSDSERLETYTATRQEENLNGGRDSDVLAASRAHEWVRKTLAKQIDGARVLHVVPTDSAPPCLSPQELPGMWEESDLSGGEADTANDRYASVTRKAPPVDLRGRDG